ncbi:efflux RND transporter periplasmic adaptor subunit [Pseudomonas nicosulfuronedens]|uniref:Efflux RND transporter periplasmic adaptor subunit n=1 Tax=Pseudomonas nicosulfuronedens TaxID=2571105 RepID=A0A5R9R747_9PSED|nr:efflux RND transporter periplasmic adaptor subunit [Pseudomonas nicosulfuronedens]MDH1009664.1 efflux RND transporter periplasmic adaptor subunit [Pseudomonas nicosulfuronedens]MDH1980963.1 efflux RND transporter periplasmic adaptor subunit [Pseudomonas nicosulfuronedens]MDH2027776.1 efflux RND transporter periplasmic adaptor subunit [Pseudomonas nicosulfuronedens]TLX78678.1 efflux RND transporter periplasmic adaptor subunit [Pseudomonas nicosulfuronedens]
MLRRMLIMLGVVAVIVAVLAGSKYLSIKKQIAMFSAPRPPVSVNATLAEQRDWQSRLAAIGTLRAIQGVTLTAEVSGTVSAVQFVSGEKVKIGQPVVQLESDVEQATLRTAEADLGLAQVEYERGKSLVGRQAISKSEYDRLAAQLNRSTATVAQLKASLDKKRILAPFSGTIGIRQVDVGDYVSPGTEIVTLQDLSTLQVDFFLPEQDFPLLKRGQKVVVRVAAYPGQSFDAQIDAISPRVDNQTRNLLVRASMANPDGKLLPGMFANLEVQLPDSAPRVIVPETAVAFTLYGNSVYVVVPQKKKADDKDADVASTSQTQVTESSQRKLEVERRFVKTGERREGSVVILEGLKAGEEVVTSGQLKLDNGTAVAIVKDPQ